MNRLSPRRKLSPAAKAADSVCTSKKAEEFGSAGSISGTAGDGSVGINEIIGTNNSQAGASLTEGDDAPPQQQQEPHQQKKQQHHNDISYYEDDEVLLWSDDPEKEYFEYILQQEQEQRARQGKSAEDSLIGDSTIGEIQMHNENEIWEQQGGETSGEVGEDSSYPEFPILSTSYNNGGNTNQSVFGGYSLATTEKSPTIVPPSQTQQSRYYPATPGKEPPPTGGPRFYPKEIFVTGDTPPTPGTISSKMSIEESKAATATAQRRRGTCFYMVVFLLGSIAMAGAAVAIYLSLAKGGGGSSSNASSSLENGNVNKFPLFTGEPLEDDDLFVPLPTVSPTRFPSASLLPRRTAEPTMVTVTNPDDDVGTGGNDDAIETGTPTFKPTSAPTTKPSEPPQSKEPTLPPVTERPTSRSSSAETRCGCKECGIVEQLGDSDGIPCVERVDFLMQELSYTEDDACRLVAGEEFPVVCSGSKCNPDLCIRESNVLSAATESSTNQKEPNTTPFPTARPTSSTITARPTSQSPPPVSSRAPTTLRPSWRPATQRPKSLPPSLRPTTPRPTERPQPTQKPTPRPTSLELDELGNDGFPANVFPLGRCQGDCDNDDECGEGLVCFQRIARDFVPGCLDGDEESSNTDFCIPEGFTWTPTFQPTWEPTFKSINRDTPAPSETPVDFPDTDIDSNNDDGGGDYDDDQNFSGMVCNLIGVFC